MMSKKRILEDKVILITGSTTGIGEAVARACVARGAKVMVHGRREEAAKTVVKSLGSGVAGYTLADIAQPSNCEKIVADTIKQFGTINGVINNAAMLTRSDIATVDAELFDKQMGINLRAPMLIAKAAIAYWRSKKQGGNIVNIGSINAYCGQSDLLTYSMTKGGMMTMTRNLADALGTENIRVNQVNVGWTLTPNEIELKKAEGLPNDWPAHLPKKFAPTGTLLKPEQVARHVVFWVSDASAPANGAVFDLEQYPMRGRNWINKLVNL